MTDKTQTTDNGQLESKAKQEPVEEQASASSPENVTEIKPEEDPADEKPVASVEAETTEAISAEKSEEEVEITTDQEEEPQQEQEEEQPGEEQVQEESVPEELPVEVPAELPDEAPEEMPEAAAAIEEPEVVSEPEAKGEEEIQEAVAEEEVTAVAEQKEEIKAEDEDAGGKKKKATAAKKAKAEAEHNASDDDEDESDNALISQLNEHEDSSDDHDEEEEEEEEEEEPAEKYEEFNREELLKKLEEVVAEENVQKIKTRVALIKVSFLRLSREEQQEKLNAFLKEGGAREAFVAEEDPLMDRFNEVFEIYRKNKAKFNEEQEVLKLRNLDAKKQILEELKELINSDESLKKTYDRFKELQGQWKDIGLVPSTEINNLWQNYHFLVEKFFDKVKISKELRDLDLKKNMEMKIELCEKAEELLLEPSILKSFKQLQKYHEEWKEIGPVPADKRDEIWERFKNATDKINERRREHYNSLSQQREVNLDEKNRLCDEAEQVVSAEANTIKEWQDNTRKINDLFTSWKNLGPAPKKDNDEVWERFKTYLNTFFSNKKEYFSKLKQEQLNNFNLKLDICKEAESLKDSTDWKITTRDLINLQKEWKKIGPVPRKHSDRIWKRFRAACDEFFQKKSEHFGSLQKNETENLEKKLDLIKRVQEHEFGSNKNENLQLLKEFQREWMEIGHVPIKEKDKVQKAFREAINQQLDRLNIHSSEIRVSEYRPRYDQGRGHDHDRGDGNPSRREMGMLAGKINKLKEDIQLWENNIGFLANSKRADIVKKEFEEKIERAKEELAASMSKLRELQEAED